MSADETGAAPERAGVDDETEPAGPDRPVVACVLAGGVGTRLYPAARSDRPKQFLPFGGDESLLSRTLERTGFADATCVVTREAFAAAVARQAPEAAVYVEPEPSDTGPAVVYAAARIRAETRRGTLFDSSVGTDGDGDHARDPDGHEESVVDPVIVTLPADHHVPNVAAFERAMTRGARVAAETGSLVTFGVEPTRPETGYGYVQPGTQRGGYREVTAFHEKPDRETAEEYLSGGYYWNSGLFAWTPGALFAACRNTPLAETADRLRSAADARASERDAAGEGVGEREAADDEPPDDTGRSGDADDAGRAGGSTDGEGGALPATAVRRAYEAAPTVSVDEAVLERAANALVVPAAFEWDDLGAWDALERVFPTDADGNATDCEAVAVDAANNVVAGDHHVSLVGVEDLCVVAVEDRVLVVPKSEAQRVREVVTRLRERDAF